MLIQCAEQYMDVCSRGAETGEPFSREEDLRLNIIAREALTMAWNAMQGELFRTAGTSLARNGQTPGADLPRHGDGVGPLRHDRRRLGRA